MPTKKWYHDLPPKEGALHGWHHDEGEEKRHAALLRAVRAEGYQPTIARLNRLMLWTRPGAKRADPSVNGPAFRDEHWLQRRHARELKGE